MAARGSQRGVQSRGDAQLDHGPGESKRESKPSDWAAREGIQPEPCPAPWHAANANASPPAHWLLQQGLAPRHPASGSPLGTSPTFLPEILVSPLCPSLPKRPCCPDERRRLPQSPGSVALSRALRGAPDPAAPRSLGYLPAAVPHGRAQLCQRPASSSPTWWTAPHCWPPGRRGGGGACPRSSGGWSTGDGAAGGHHRRWAQPRSWAADPQPLGMLETG